MKLADVADYVGTKISSNDIKLEDYVTTDSLLQSKGGRERAQNLPPCTCMLTHYLAGDVLVANIRPYLKKVWLADKDGGASADVLVFRAKPQYSPSFLYAILMQDNFYNYVMKGTKGSKMPRGDKEQIMRFPITDTILPYASKIGCIISSIEEKTSLNRAINRNLPTLDRSSRGAEVRRAA